jgi:hypothetical protein
MSKLSRLKCLGMMILLGGILVLGACAYDNDNDTTDDGTTDDGTDTSEVAGANQDIIYGYIVEINDQARTVLVDEFDLVTDADTEKIGDMGLDRDNDFINGYYIYNTSNVTRLYPLDTTANYQLSDFDYTLSDFYNQRWDKTGTYNTGAENNNATSNNTDNLTGTNGNDTYTADNLDNNTVDTDTAIDSGTVNSFGRNNGNSVNDNTTGTNVTNYSADDLQTRIGDYENVPFMLTIENGKVVKIEELDYLYR